MGPVTEARRTVANEVGVPFDQTAHAYSISDAEGNGGIVIEVTYGDLRDDEADFSYHRVCNGNVVADESGALCR